MVLDSLLNKQISSSNTIALEDGSISMEITMMPMAIQNNPPLTQTKNIVNPYLNQKNPSEAKKMSSRNNSEDPKDTNLKKKSMMFTIKK